MSREIRFTVPLVVTALISLLAVADGAKRPAARWASYDLPQVATINKRMIASWKEWEIKPSQNATEGEWCRRVYLDVIGRIPTVSELYAFTKSKDKSKKRTLVNRLLYDERYTEEYARNWTTVWTNVLIGRSGGTERNSLTSREGMQKYLRDCFARNKPYDRMVRDLVAAVGSSKPGAENFNGATNFLTMKVNEEKGTLATAATARIFLGLQVQCTQCHNHPFNEWKQQKFWEFNAFFRQTRALRRFRPGTRDVNSAELVDEDFGGEGTPQTPGEAEIYYEQRNAVMLAAYPVFVDGREIGRSGFVEDANRRSLLADLMTSTNRTVDRETATYLELAAANRLWGHFLGYGFTTPIDDMGPHNSPTHPELLNYLGLQFREASYDLKQMAEWITLSAPYGLSSQSNTTNVTLDDPLLGEDPKFSRFYLRQMRAEELYESLVAATQADKNAASYEEQEKEKNKWLQQFTVAFGNDEGEEATIFNGTIPQALMMFNGDLIKKATSADKGGFLSNLANNRRIPNSRKIDFLFQAGLGRRPTDEEIDRANRLLILRVQDEKGDINKDTIAAMQDVWWAILNSNEFIINH